MKKNPTPTTCTALTIVTPAARCTRTDGAAYPQPVIILPATLPTLTDADRARRLYAVAHAATAVCLRARSQSEGGEGYVSEVRRQWYNDAQVWERAPEFADRAAQHRLTHDQHRETAEAAQAIADKLTREADKLTTNATDRAALLAAAHTHEQTASRARAAAADELAAAEAIDKLIEQTAAADRESIVHEAVVGYLTADHSDTEADAFRKACSAAGRAIDATRAAAGYTAVKTRLERMGGEGSSEADNVAAYEAWTEQHPGAERIPFLTRGRMADGWITAEKRKASKPRKDGTSRRPAGYYLVRHYRTTTTAPLDEAMNLEAPQPVSLLDVRRLITAASLTARQRTALLLLTIATGAAKPTSTDPAKVERIRKAAALIRRAGRQAAEQHDAETAAAVAACDTQRKRQRKQRERAKQRTKAQDAAMLNAALVMAGVPAQQLANQRKTLRDKLTAAMERTRHDQTPRKAAPATAQPVTVSRLTASGATLYTVTPDTSRPAERHPYPGHVATMGWLDVVWSQTYDPAAAHVITEADREADRAAARKALPANAQALDEALTLRRACRDHQPTRTAYAAHDAQSAAAVFLLSMSAAELAEVGAAMLAEREAAAARAAARAAAAKASGIYGLNTTFAMWQSWTDEERAEHMRFLASL